jgi:hypothetical protein
MSSRPPYFRKVDQVADMGRYRQALNDARLELEWARSWADHLAAIIFQLLADEEGNRDWSRVAATLSDFRAWWIDTEPEEVDHAE